MITEKLQMKKEGMKPNVTYPLKRKREREEKIQEENQRVHEIETELDKEKAETMEIVN
jgi:hypothetical protein